MKIKHQSKSLNSEDKETYLGKLSSIRYMSVGSKDLPRVPSFIGFRHAEDIG